MRVISSIQREISKSILNSNAGKSEYWELPSLKFKLAATLFYATVSQFYALKSLGTYFHRKSWFSG